MIFIQSLCAIHSTRLHFSLQSAHIGSLFLTFQYLFTFVMHNRSKIELRYSLHNQGSLAVKDKVQNHV